MSLDENGYPDEASLEAIEHYDYVENGIEGLLSLIKENWHFLEWGYSRTPSRLYLSTGGWSGNESVIGAMRMNFLFWSLHWMRSRRGGHYVFEVPRLRS
ncbi:hypothetical protein LCGC14_1940210 [marine sediment metagenome]|uniref:Uncharacterized protein n=1 Tax=marine sediment metagenome TaxID=412755 RepID=A0A0F9HYY9_9ZZZZ